MIMGFVDRMRIEGHAVESTCRVLREQGLKVAARTYRDWHRATPSARTVSDAHLVNQIRQLCWAAESARVL